MLRGEAGPKVEQGEYREIDIRVISADPSWNSRSNTESDLGLSGLAATIAEKGLLNPITVCRVDRPGEPWPTLTYRVVAGFRRLAACVKLGWTRIPAIIIQTDAEGARVTNLTENIARKNLRLFDTMRTMSDLHFNAKITVRRLSKDTGVSLQRVQKYVQTWPKLSKFIKEQWSKIDDACWEPSLHQVWHWKGLSHAEQDRAWREWCNDQANTGELDELELGEGAPKQRRNRKRHVRDIKAAIDSLGKTDVEEGQRRALLWAIGRRESF